VIIEIRNQMDFEKVICSGISLINFNATWCASCKEQEHIIKKLIEFYKKKIIIASVNVDMNKNLANNFGIKSIPTLLICKNCKELQRLVGLQAKDTIIEIINKTFKS